MVRTALAVAASLCRGAGNLDAATARRGYKIMRIGLNLVASVAFVASSSHSCLAKTAAANETKPRIEICFVLDTTRSIKPPLEAVVLRTTQTSKRGLGLLACAVLARPELE